MLKGTVRWFSNLHGYGFILDETGNQIFVHFSAIARSGYKTLKDGQEVLFESAMGPKGEHATVVIPQGLPDTA